MLRKGMAVCIALALALCAAMPMAVSEEMAVPPLTAQDQPAPEAGDPVTPTDAPPPAGVEPPAADAGQAETDVEPTASDVGQNSPDVEAQAEMPETDEENADAQPEEAARTDLDTALVFWQEREVELHYWWDEQSQAWYADPLEPVEVVVYVSNTADVPVGPIVIAASTLEATDEGRLFSMECRLLPQAQSLTLAPGESAQVAVLSFTGSGGESLTVEPGQLAVELTAAYEQHE